ncbi:MAG: deoxyribose-phosphate aldolase [Bacillota bacterium]
MAGFEIAKFIDHTLLKPQAAESDIIQLCKEAKQFKFAAVCVNPCYVNLAAKLLTGTSVRIAVVVGFPLGAATTETKVFEAIKAFEDGAHEVDMVMNVGALKSGRDEYVLADIQGVVNEAKKQIPKKIVKVIIETSLLNGEEKEKACRLCIEAGADFVKTSTGFNGGGATIEDIQLMKKVVGDKGLVKASGGIRDLEKAIAMVKAGADRIGTSSGVTIMSSTGTDLGESNDDQY